MPIMNKLYISREWLPEEMEVGVVISSGKQTGQGTVWGE